MEDDTSRKIENEAPQTNHRIWSVTLPTIMSYFGQYPPGISYIRSQERATPSRPASQTVFSTSTSTCSWHRPCVWLVRQMNAWLLSYRTRTTGWAEEVQAVQEVFGREKFPFPRHPVSAACAYRERRRGSCMARRLPSGVSGLSHRLGFG